MTEEGSRPSDPLGSPDESRGGPDIDAAVENAESGSQVEGVHTPSGTAESGESRLEQMREVDTSSDRHDGEPSATPTPPKPGPPPSGSGGAQRIEGARISDRVAGGEPEPDGPPFDDQVSER
jgi:hypothetical protein